MRPQPLELVTADWVRSIRCAAQGATLQRVGIWRRLAAGTDDARRTDSGAQGPGRTGRPRRRGRRLARRDRRVGSRGGGAGTAVSGASCRPTPATASWRMSWRPSGTPDCVLSTTPAGNSNSGLPRGLDDLTMTGASASWPWPPTCRDCGTVRRPRTASASV